MLSSLKVPECRRITYFSRFKQHPTTAHLQKLPFSVCEWVQIRPSAGGSRFGVWQEKKSKKSNKLTRFYYMYIKYFLSTEYKGKLPLPSHGQTK